MKDKQGREYARMGELQPGSTVTVDGDFPCIPPWRQRTVLSDDHGLYVMCSGPDDQRQRLVDTCHHYLDGQETDEEDYLIGVYPGVVYPNSGRLK